MMSDQSLQPLCKILNKTLNFIIYLFNYIPVLSLICPSLVFLPNITPGLPLAIVNLISNVSNPSVTLSQVIDTLALPSVAPAFILIVNGLELKSTPDPITVQ